MAFCVLKKLCVENNTIIISEERESVPQSAISISNARTRVN